MLVCAGQYVQGAVVDIASIVSCGDAFHVGNTPFAAVDAPGDRLYSALVLFAVDAGLSAFADLPGECVGMFDGVCLGELGLSNSCLVIKLHR